MCDDITELENKKYFEKEGMINRYDFGKITVLASLMAMIPSAANAVVFRNRG